jgi:hypothetical protein
VELDVSTISAALLLVAVAMTAAGILLQRRRSARQVVELDAWDDADSWLRDAGFERLDESTYVKAGAVFVRNSREHVRVEASLEVPYPGGRVLRHFPAQSARVSIGGLDVGPIATWVLGLVTESLTMMPRGAEIRIDSPTAIGAAWQLRVTSPLRDAQTPLDAVRLLEDLAKADSPV